MATWSHHVLLHRLTFVLCQQCQSTAKVHSPQEHSAARPQRIEYTYACLQHSLPQHVSIDCHVSPAPPTPNNAGMERPKTNRASCDVAAAAFAGAEGLQHLTRRLPLHAALPQLSRAQRLLGAAAPRRPGQDALQRLRRLACSLCGRRLPTMAPCSMWAPSAQSHCAQHSPLSRHSLQALWIYALDTPPDHLVARQGNCPGGVPALQLPSASATGLLLGPRTDVSFRPSSEERGGRRPLT